MAKIFIVIFVAAISVGCASGHCRGRENIGEASKLRWQDEEQTKKQKSEKVYVYKADGSLQCGMGQAVKMDVMAKELVGVVIHKMDNRSDGFMHIQACGTPTGRVNVYQISVIDLEKANKAGFKELKD